MFIIEFAKEALTEFSKLVDSIEGPRFMFVAQEARLTAKGCQITGQYDRDNAVITFVDDGTGHVYNILSATLPPKTPHYIDGTYGTF